LVLNLIHNDQCWLYLKVSQLLINYLLVGCTCAYVFHLSSVVSPCRLRPGLDVVMG
jgi:hypothetical protein